MQEKWFRKPSYTRLVHDTISLFKPKNGMESSPALPFAIAPVLAAAAAAAMTDEGILVFSSLFTVAWDLVFRFFDFQAWYTLSLRWNSSLQASKSSMSHEVLIVSRNSAYFQLDRSYFVGFSCFEATSWILGIGVAGESSTPDFDSRANLECFLFSFFK